MIYHLLNYKLLINQIIKLINLHVTLHYNYVKWVSQKVKSNNYKSNNNSNNDLVSCCYKFYVKKIRVKIMLVNRQFF